MPTSPVRAYRLEKQDTAYASPRRSRTSTNSREEDVAPSTPSSARRAKRRSSSRASPRPPGQIERPVLGIVFVHGDLLEHDLALGLQFPETGPKDHVGHDLEGALEMAVEHARVQGRRLLVGPRVDLRAHRVEDLVYLLRAEALGAAKEHVLEQVRDAGLVLGLGGRA